MQKYSLKNNLMLFLEDKKDTTTVSFFLTVLAGSNYENNFPPGTAHLLEHLFFKGNKEYSKKEIAKFCEYLGGGLHAATSKETMTFELTIPKQYFSKALKMMISILAKPEFNEKMLKEEIQVIFQEIALYKDSPDDVLLDMLEEEIWASSTLANPILGTQETLEMITTSDINSFYKKHFVGSNMALAVIGDISDNQKEEIIAAFELFPRGKKSYYNAIAPKLNNKQLCSEKKILLKNI